MKQYSNIKTLVSGVYDMQKLRIQMGNRIVNNFKAKLGQEPGKREDTIDEDGKKILKMLRKSYKKITDGVSTFPRQSRFNGDEIISDYTELCLLESYVRYEEQESLQFRRLGNVLREYPIFTEYLEGVRGIGPAMAGVIISEIDIRRAEYPSSLWMYAGLDVAKDGAGRSKRPEHLIDVEYVDKNGETKTRKSITHNPFLKTKLVGVLATSFLRAGDNPYRTIFDQYKHRLENHEKHKEKTKGHRHNMAIRYMIKCFLVDLYVAWRTLEGLPVAEEYSIAKLGKRHGFAIGDRARIIDQQPLSHQATTS